MSLGPRISSIAAGCLVTATALAAEAPVDRWANAVGGREKVAPIRAIYREATVQVGSYEGWIKAWHTADGTYRKEEQIGPYDAVMTFDGTTARIRRGATPPQSLTGPELALARSSAFANWNAVFFAFFPERRRGTLHVEEDGTIVLRPDGGIDWRVTLDPQTSLPKRMTHLEGDQTVAVDFASYESVEGMQLEKELHRSIGELDAVIRFTKTILDPPIDGSLFSIEPKPEAAAAAPATTP